MIKMKTREYILMFFIFDLLMVNAAIVLSLLLEGIDIFAKPPLNELAVVLNVSCVVTYLIFIDDMQYLKSDFGTQLRLLMQRLVTFTAIAAVLAIGFGLESYTRIQFLGSIFFFLSFKSFLSLFVVYKLALRKKGRTPVVIVGDNKIGREVFRYCKENKFSGYRPLGILSDGKSIHHDDFVIGDIADFQKIYDRTPFNDAIISLPMEESQKIKDFIHIAEKNGVKPRIVLNGYGVINRNFIIKALGQTPLLDIRNVPLHKYNNRFWKRAFDIAVSSVLLLLLTPVFAIIAIAIRLEGKGPIFYTPIRLGVNGQPFKLYKFRSMKENDDALGGTRSTVLNDERITRLGNFLRKSNLDELPQLYNVLINEMSIVGPRPHRVHLNKNLQEKMGTYMVRHFVKPGITGWAQIHGWRGPTETKLQYKGRTLHDLWYIENWSFGIDIYILFLTVFGKKTRKNAF